MPGKKLISLVIPVYNEEENIERFYEATHAVISSLTQYEFEFVFTDNHSTDETYNILMNLHARDPRVRVIRFSKNFGYQRSILTGYLNAHGDAVIQLDCDLQDPPDLIPEFLHFWEQDYAVVYGVRATRDEGFFIHSARKIFYRVLNFLSEEPIPFDAGDFRLVDRKIVEVLRETYDAHPYLRGMIATVGFKQIGIEYHRKNREHGESKFSLGSLFTLAIDGILSHSIVPLRVSSILGIAVGLLTVITTFVYFIGKLFYQADWPAGFATIVILLLLNISLTSLFFGIMGEYIGRIHRQTKKEKIVIIEKQLPITGNTNSYEEAKY
jgi:polyisoprenyl-phosphate glycosyltransferase